MMVKIEYTRDKSPVVLFKKENKNYYLSSRFSSTNEAIRLAEPFKKKPQDFIILLGSGHISLIEYICNHIQCEKIIIIESSKIIGDHIKSYIKNNFSEKHKKKIIFYIEEQYLNLEIWFKNKSANDVQIFVNRTQSNLFPKFYQKAYNNVIAFYNQKSINISTISRFEKLWLRNVMKNTFQIAKNPGLKSLQNKFKERKAVVVAAGPSLKKHISFLKEVQNQIYIIAVDTILKVLLHHNIKPHFVIVVDPQKINAQYVENIPDLISKDIIYIAEPAVCHSAIRDKKNLILFDTIFPFYNLITKHFGKKGEIDLGGNVSTTAYDIAIFLGFKEVAFIGLDMCFTKDAYHMEGTMYENYWFSTSNRFHTFESKINKLLDYNSLEKQKGYKNKTIYLDAKFKMFTKWFDKKQQNNKSLTFFYNCGEDGYIFKNIPNKNFKDFIDNQKKNNIKQEFKYILKEISHTKNIDLVQFIDDLKEIMKNIKHYKKYVENAYIICQEIIQCKNEDHIQKKIQSLGELDKKLMNNFYGKELVNISIQKAIQKINQKKELNSSMDNNLKDSLYLYEEMMLGINLNLKYLQYIIDDYKKFNA